MFKHILVAAALLSPVVFFAQKKKTVKTSSNLSLSAPYKSLNDAGKDFYRYGDNMLAICYGRTASPDLPFFYQLVHKATSGLNRRVTVEKFDVSKPRFVSSAEYEDFPKGYSVEATLEFQGKLCVFYTVKDNNDPLSLFVREIDFSSGKFRGEAKKLFQTQSEVAADNRALGKQSMAESEDSKFSIVKSFDNNRLLIQYRVKPDIKRDNISKEVDGFYVFDPNFELIWGNEVQMPYTEKKMNVIDFSLDNEGNTYILAQVYNDNSTREKTARKGPANYHVEMIRVLKGETQETTTKLNVNEKFIQDVRLKSAPDNQMICAGYYCQGKDMDNVNGVFTFKTGADGTIAQMNTYEIPAAVINMYKKKKGAKTAKSSGKKEPKDNLEMTDLQMCDIIVTPDGSLIITGEQQYTVAQASSPAGGSFGGAGMGAGAMVSQGPLTASISKARVTYYYCDILATRIDPSGNLAWMKRLPKHQLSTYRMNNLSFHHMVDTTMGDSYFIFFDNIENVGKKLGERPTPSQGSPKHTVLSYYRIAAKDGKLTRSNLTTMKDVKGMKLSVLSMDQFSEGPDNFVFEAHKKRKENVLVRVNLKKAEK